MKFSSRNQFQGKVKELKKGPVTTEVVIEVNNPVTVVATITTTSADTMDLKTGDDVLTLIKASHVIVGK